MATLPSQIWEEIDARNAYRFPFLGEISGVELSCLPACTYPGATPFLASLAIEGGSRSIESIA